MDAKRAVDTCAADLRVSPGATADTHAIRQRFTDVDAKYRANLQRGMTPAAAINDTPAMIPDGVATQGSADRARRAEVLDMIGCAGDRAGLGAGMTQELRGMYKDATNAKGGNFLGWLFGR